MEYKIMICGGTFDLLHAGHKYFLEKILDLSEKVIIGLTTDKYILENKPDRGIASFQTRKNKLESFFKERVEGRVEIIPIDDFYGPLLDPNFKADAIAISEQRENAMKINEERKGRGLKPLEVVELKTWRGGDRKKVSSTRIRKGEIDSEGKNLILPSTLRHLLQDVWGEILENVPENLDPNKIITVGDVTTAKFRNLGKIPKISIVDFKVERKPISEACELTLFAGSKFDNSNIVKVKNSPGTISRELQNEILRTTQNDNAEKTVIVVDGEEDLSVLPALLYAPVGFEVFYGQPNVGLVRIKVDEEIKKRAIQLISQFEPSV